MQVVVGAVIAGKYQLETPLARGGMGSVWVARHVKLGSRLAVKFLDPRFAASPAFIERFEREARAAAALQSPNVVHVQDYGVEDDTPYLVMELLQGEDLGQRLSRLGRLSLPETARILMQVGKALRKAHEGGIVHRDLKPANLFLMRADDDEVVKVLDFGIAKEVASVGEATKTGEVMGSPHYMSPEQARADKGVDHRADVWALGVILYRAVTGALPFPGDVLGAVLSRILVDPVPPVGSVAPDLPASLDGFFAKAMAKSKEHRFQSVREMVDAFVGIAGLPMSTSGPSALGASSAGFPGAPGHGPPGLAGSSPGLAGSSPGLAGSPPGLAGSSPHAAGHTPHLSGSSPQLAGHTPHLSGSSPGLAGSGPHATQLLSGTGPSTLAAASTTNSGHVKPSRSAAPWVVAGGLVVLLVAGGGALGYSQFGGGASGGAPDSSGPVAPTAAPSAAEPSGGSAGPATGAPTDTPAPAGTGAPSSDPAAAPAIPTAPLAVPTGAVGGAATGTVTKPPGTTTAAAKVPVPDKKPASPQQPTTKPAPKPTAKPGGGWGF